LSLYAILLFLELSFVGGVAPSGVSRGLPTGSKIRAVVNASKTRAFVRVLNLLLEQPFLVSHFFAFLGKRKEKTRFIL